MGSSITEHSLTSPTRRRALQFDYPATDAEWLDSGPEAFGAEGKDVYC